MSLFTDVRDLMKRVGDDDQFVLVMGFGLALALPALGGVTALLVGRAWLLAPGLLLGVAAFVWALRRLERAAVRRRDVFRTITILLDSMVEFQSRFYGALTTLRDGDFSVPLGLPVEANSQGPEYDRLFYTLREAIDKIKGENVQSQRISFELVKSVRELMEAGTVQASGSSEQASSIAEITATMEELARTAGQIADNSNKVAKLAENSDHASKEGSELINSVIRSIESIDGKMNQISEKVHALGQHSKQISKVLDIISDISSETHLLALNAAIESVAAGEFGKRFSVIAAEVRRLAEISHENAESIRAIIEQFQNAINGTVMAIEEGTKMTSNVNETAQAIIRHLEKIVQATASTSQSIGEISIATQQQRSASDQIVLTLKDISQVTRQQAQELKRSSKEIEKLNALALSLQLMTQQTIIDSSFNLGYQGKTFAGQPEISGMDRRLQQQSLARIVEEHSYIELIYIVDHDGKMFSFNIAKQGADNQEMLFIGGDFSKRSWFVHAVDSRRPYISEVYKSLLTSEDCFTVSIGIFNADGACVGVLGLDVNAREWNRIVA
ncbi:MAG: methyl-accepting chemotaxis protein [Candidatus Aminicenantes bacterium]|nr:methyl-accepting chemotaxis protein [Candidatus Aminicenantes bacterium]